MIRICLRHCLNGTYLVSMSAMLSSAAILHASISPISTASRITPMRRMIHMERFTPLSLFATKTVVWESMYKERIKQVLHVQDKLLLICRRSKLDVG